MKTFGQKLRYLRQQKQLSIDDMIRQLKERYETNISKSMISRYENDKADVSLENVRIFTDFFDVPQDYFIKDNVEPKVVSDLNKKDERDIAKELEKLIDGLSSNSGYAAFDGSTADEMDPEDKELLISSLENSLKLAKRLSKQKFTPKKYRK